MRRRLVAVFLPLFLLLVVAISVPAAGAIAGRHTTALVNDRLNDAARFAIAAFASVGSDTSRLEAELDDYAELYDTPLWLIDREREVVHFSGAAAQPPASAEQLISLALAGQSPEFDGTVWPWGPSTVTIATPVGRDSQVSAALLLEVPAASASRAVLGEWMLVGAIIVIPVAAGLWLLWPLSRWLLRPIEDLERSVSAVTSGDLRARSAIEHGPPELRVLGRHLDAMVDTVESTIARQREFVADASHQLRTPLAAVRISVENLQPHLGLDAGSGSSGVAGGSGAAGSDSEIDDAEESYRDAIDGIERMTEMVSALLAATELQGRPARVCTVAEALDRRPPVWVAQGVRAGVTVSVELDETATIVEPGGGLAIVIDELLANALRLANASTVEIVGRSLDERYAVTVTDDGVGMDAIERSNALKRFWRSPRTQNLPGTGLGLGIVGQLATDVGGSVELDDAPGGGLRVTVTMPLAEYADPPG